MEPLSITVACVSLLSGVAKLSIQAKDFVASVRDARKDMISVQAELRSLSICLETLRDDSMTTVYPDAFRENLLTVLKHCGTVTTQMTVLLDKYSSINVLRRIQWSASGRDEMNQLRSSLESHKSALGIGLDMTSLFLISTVKAGINEVRADTAQIASIKYDTSHIEGLVQQIALLRKEIDRLSTDDAKAQHLRKFLDESSSYAESVYDGNENADSSTSAEPYMFALKTAVPKEREVRVQASNADLVDRNDNLLILTLEKHAQYSELFDKAGAVQGELSVLVARQIFERSMLPTTILQDVWMLINPQRRSSLCQTEFVFAMHLLVSVKVGVIQKLPSTLPSDVIDVIAQRKSHDTLTESNRVSAGTLARSSLSPSKVCHMIEECTCVGDEAGRSVKPKSIDEPWAIIPADKARWDVHFSTLDTSDRGYLTNDQAYKFFMHARLSEEILQRICRLAAISSQGRLNRDEFAIAMYLIKQQRGTPGAVLPGSLPRSLIPPYMRKQTQTSPQTTVPMFSNKSSARSQATSDDLIGLITVPSAPVSTLHQRVLPVDRSNVMRNRLNSDDAVEWVKESRNAMAQAISAGRYDDVRGLLEQGTKVGSDYAAFVDEHSCQIPVSKRNNFKMLLGKYCTAQKADNVMT